MLILLTVIHGSGVFGLRYKQKKLKSNKLVHLYINSGSTFNFFLKRIEICHMNILKTHITLRHFEHYTKKRAENKIFKCTCLSFDSDIIIDFLFGNVKL